MSECSTEDYFYDNIEYGTLYIGSNGYGNLSDGYAYKFYPGWLSYDIRSEGYYIRPVKK